MTLGDFTGQSEAYRRSRPAYPVELLDAVIADASIHSGDAVADFGAGTGILTRMLIERGFDVSAVEPNDSMSGKAELPQARWFKGTFEDSGLPDQSQRWAVAAQAFHWADPPRCLPEIYRILQPRCLFTVLWNNRARSDNEIVNWTETAIRRQVPEFDEAYRNRLWGEILESTGHFAMVNQRTFAHVVPMSRERYLELWKSHNRLNVIAGPDRFQLFFTELGEYLSQQSVEQINVRYDCEAWSARRID